MRCALGGGESPLRLASHTQMSITRGALRLWGVQLDRDGMTVPLAWLGELGAGKFAQEVAGCCLLYGGPCLPPALQPPAPAMTDPSACKTTIALISGGGKGCLRAPWAPGPFFQLGFPSPGSGVPWGGGGEVRGQRSPVSHDEVGVFLHLEGGPRCEGYPAEPPISHCGHLIASLPSRSPHCLGPYLSSSPRAQAGRLETQGMAPT